MIRAKDIRARLDQDMHTTAVSNGVTIDAEMRSLMSAFASDAMFQIEHLLVEVEALHIEKKARDEKDVEDEDSESVPPEVWLP